MRLALAATLTLLATTSSVASTARAEPVPLAPAFEPGPCLTERPEALHRQATRVCGTVQVPAVPGGPLGDDAIPLAVEVIRTGGAPALEATVLMEGDPATARLLHLPTSLGRVGRAVWPGRDLVLFDPRGAGFSGPQSPCPEAGALAAELVLAGTAEARAAFVAALRGCRDASKGLRRDAATLASDVELVRQATGYERVGIWATGASVDVALEVARRVPERVSAMVLDRAEPPPATPAAAWALLQGACDAAPECPLGGARLEADVAALRAELDAAPQAVATRDPLTGAVRSVTFDGAALDLLALSVWRAPEFVPALPQTLADLRAGQSGLAGLLLSALASEPLDVSWGAWLVSSCPGAPPAAAGAPASREAARAAARACGPLADTPAPPQANPARSTTMPTLLVRGTLAPDRTPGFAAASEDAVATLTVPGAGRAASLTTPCATDAAVAFLKDPTAAELADACAGLPPRIAFTDSPTGARLAGALVDPPAPLGWLTLLAFMALASLLVAGPLWVLAERGPSRLQLLAPRLVVLADATALVVVGIQASTAAVDALPVSLYTRPAWLDGSPTVALVGGVATGLALLASAWVWRVPGVSRGARLHLPLAALGLAAGWAVLAASSLA